MKRIKYVAITNFITAFGQYNNALVSFYINNFNFMTIIIRSKI